MSRFANARVRALARLRGQDRFRLLDRVGDRLYMPADELRDLQLNALRRLLVHAYDTTTAYRQIMDEAGVDPRKLDTTDDLARLPLTTKSAMRDRCEDFFSSAYALGDCEKKSTSGSSGTPLTFYRDGHYFELGNAGTMRNMATGGWRPGDALALIWGYLSEVETFGGRLRSWFSQTYHLNAYQQTEEAMTRWRRLLETKRICFLYGFPSSLHVFARHLLDRDRTLPMKAVFCTAEKYFDFERVAIEKAFSCKSYDLYGSSEIQNIAAECPRGNLHVASDFVVIEEIEGDDATPPRFALTSLHNYCMPFIRYDLGDHGRLLEETCDCGINTPLIEVLGGSKYDFLQTPTGVIHGGRVGQIFKKVPGIRRYQVVQHDCSRFTVRCEIPPECDAPETRRLVEESGRQVLTELMGEAVQIAYEYPDEIRSGPGGKFRFVYRESATREDT